MEMEAHEIKMDPKQVDSLVENLLAITGWINEIREGLPEGLRAADFVAFWSLTGILHALQTGKTEVSHSHRVEVKKFAFRV